MPELVEGTLGRGAMPEDAHYGSPQGAFPLLEELNKQWERGKLQSPCTMGRVWAESMYKSSSGRDGGSNSMQRTRRWRQCGSCGSGAEKISARVRNSDCRCC